MYLYIDRIIFFVDNTRHIRAIYVKSFLFENVYYFNEELETVDQGYINKIDKSKEMIKLGFKDGNIIDLLIDKENIEWKRIKNTEYQVKEILESI